MSSSAPAWGRVAVTTTRSGRSPIASSTAPGHLAGGLGGHRVLGERAGERHAAQSPVGGEPDVERAEVGVEAGVLDGDQVGRAGPTRCDGCATGPGGVTKAPAGSQSTRTGSTMAPSASSRRADQRVAARRALGDEVEGHALVAVGSLDPAGRQDAEHGPQGVGDGEGLGVAVLPSSTLTRLRSAASGSRSTSASRARASAPSNRVGSKRASAGCHPEIAEQRGIGHPVAAGRPRPASAGVGGVHGGAPGRQGQEVARPARHPPGAAGAGRPATVRTSLWPAPRRQ